MTSIVILDNTLENFYSWSQDVLQYVSRPKYGLHHLRTFLATGQEMEECNECEVVGKNATNGYSSGGLCIFWSDYILKEL